MADYTSILAAIDAAILSLVQGKVSEVSINNRTWKYSDLGQLRELRKDYAKLQRQAVKPALSISQINRGWAR